MVFSLLHPREQLAAIMGRIYAQELTTLTGGNLSILDEAGDLWITPSGIDKGSLRPQDIMCVRSALTSSPAGEAVEGPHRPSSELPFHTAIYRRRPDLRAIVHAHSRALVTFSMLRAVPDTRALAQAYAVCGPVGYAPYAMMSSDQLAVNVAAVFAEGYDAALFENHSGATGGADLLQAFQRFETLDFCARTIIQACGLSQGAGLAAVHPLDEEQLALLDRADDLPEFTPTEHSSRERELRQQVVEIVHRAYDRCLMTSTQGVVSARVGQDRFLITPTAMDRRAIGLADVVLVSEGRREAGKQPTLGARLHRAIYRRHPEIGSAISAQAPHITAYALVPQGFDTKTIPESYVILRHVPKIDFKTYADSLLGDAQEAVAARLSPRTPALIVEHDGLLTTGATILQAFDRLEIAEYSAQSLIDITAKVGHWTPLEEPRLRELEVAFGLE